MFPSLSALVKGCGVDALIILFISLGDTLPSMEELPDPQLSVIAGLLTKSVSKHMWSF